MAICIYASRAISFSCPAAEKRDIIAVIDTISPTAAVAIRSCHFAQLFV